HDPQRITVRIPPDQKQWVKRFQSLPHRIWHADNGVWSIRFNRTNIRKLERLFGQQLHFAFDWQAQLLPQQQSLTDQPLPSSAPSSATPSSFPLSAKDKIRIEQENHRWLKVFVPLPAKGWRAIIKSIPGRSWNPIDQYWRIPYVNESLLLLNTIDSSYLNYTFNPSALIPAALTSDPPPSPISKRPIDRINAQQKIAVIELEERLTLERKSWRTIKSYRKHLIDLFAHFPKQVPEEITEQQIQNYLMKKIKRQQVAESTQNQIINALKAYYGRVLDQTNKVQWIPRPKKVHRLPNVLSLAEVETLLNSINNLKHKTMISLVYAAGLRKSEVLKLRLKDVILSRSCLFIKSAKGKKDRFVGLSPTMIEMIRAYRSVYSPRYWLFEGQKGGQYSETSLQSIFHKAKTRSSVNPYITLHGLRHSYATHLVENGTPLHAVKELLGHNSIKTTEIYLHLSASFLKTIKSPIERLKLT
ncbi:MAG: tyrosine-type recombinase/integrase, partial [Bacteroidota bacterium]